MSKDWPTAEESDPAGDVLRLLEQERERLKKPPVYDPLVEVSPGRYAPCSHFVDGKKLVRRLREVCGR